MSRETEYVPYLPFAKENTVSSFRSFRNSTG